MLTWLRTYYRGVRSELELLRWRVPEAVRLAEGALLGTDPRAGIWEYHDYLCAILATLTSGERARTAAMACYAREEEREDTAQRLELVRTRALAALEAGMDKNDPVLLARARHYLAAGDPTPPPRDPTRVET